MQRIMHVADLHLSSAPADQPYCLDVLSEIVDRAETLEVSTILFCGDTFDNFKDLEALRGDFRSALSGFSGDIFMIPGNHEDIARGDKPLTAYDLGKARLLAEKPFSRIIRDQNDPSFEILAIPHQGDLGDFRSWTVEPKTTRYRIAMAHGTVAGMSYTGPDVEEGGGAIDPDLFSHLNVDYAALGHIHDRRSQRRDGAVLSYAGSARVWRRGETSPRGVLIITLDERLHTEFVPLKKAGTYRTYDLTLEFDGTLPEYGEFASWESQDYVEIRLSGIVEDEFDVRDAEERFRKKYSERVRRLDIRRDGLLVLAGISSQPLAKRFLELWRQAEPQPDDDDYEWRKKRWLRARDIGLTEIKHAVESLW